MEKMKRVGITDPHGFLGRHIRWSLLPKKDQIEVVEIPVSLLHGNADALSALVKNCDVLVHVASAHPRNTPDEKDIYPTNTGFARALTDACDASGVSPHIIFASSTHIHSDTAYGTSKKDAGTHFRTWGAARQAPVTNLIIPNEFGEGGKPFDVSFVSTFCHQLARSERSEVSSDASVALIHAQEVAHAVYEVIVNPAPGDIELPGTQIAVAEVYSILRDFHGQYSNDIVPVLTDRMHTALFNTLRYHLWENGFYPRPLQLKSDARGALFDIVKEKTGGQTFMSTTEPGKTRGEHYHTRKIERFCVLQGSGTIRLRKVLEDTVFSYDVSGESPAYIDMPTFVTHDITNTGNVPLLTAFWCNEILDLSDSDTYQLPVV